MPPMVALVNGLARDAILRDLRRTPVEFTWFEDHIEPRPPQSRRVRIRRWLRIKRLYICDYLGHVRDAALNRPCMYEHDDCYWMGDAGTGVLQPPRRR